MMWVHSLSLKRLGRLTLKRHHYEQTSYEAHTQIDAETAEVMKRKTEMKICQLKSRLENAGLTSGDISDYLARSPAIRLAKDQAARARRLPV